MKINNIELEWLGHAGFKINNNKIIYVDPYNISTTEKADIILITHGHYDHCSIADISKIVKNGTVIIVPADCQSKITKLTEKVEMQIIEPLEEIKLENIKVMAVLAYNKNKEFHPKSEAWLGYLIKIGNVIIYHAGDSDLIPEMEKLTGYGKIGNEFIALLPVGGTYTMNAEEAAEAALVLKPTLAIPMHYASIVGSKEDAEKFVQLCQDNGIKAEILERS